MYAGNDILMTILEISGPAPASKKPRRVSTKPIAIMMITDNTLPKALSMAYLIGLPREEQPCQSCLGRLLPAKAICGTMRLWHRYTRLSPP